MRLTAAFLAPLVVIAGLFFALPVDRGSDLESVGAAIADGAARPAAAHLTAGSTEVHDGPGDVSRAAVARADTEEPEALPLTVTMTGLSSPVVPTAELVVDGTITNTTDEVWSDVNVYACTSSTPLTTPRQLARAAALTTDDRVCGRTPAFVKVGTIEPGDSARYSLTVPRDQLGIGGRPGAYWFSVQALGTSGAGRDARADGTVRTFLPQVDPAAPADANPAAFALVLPFRARTLHSADGSLTSAATWAKYVAPGGRLDNMLRLAEAAPTGQATLLVDPAVLAAVQQLAEGNPPRGLGAPAGDASSGSDGDDNSDTNDANPRARAWLARFTSAAQRLPVLGLPYGDLDVAGAVRHDPGAMIRARALSDEAFQALGLEATPAIVPEDGLLPEAARGLVDDATVIVSSEALPTELREKQIPGTVRVGEQDLWVADASLATGGPSPGPGHVALALRQRLLAEGAVRAFGAAAAPALVVLPPDADPGADVTQFFPDLNRSWLRMTDALPTATGSVAIDALTYPAAQQRREIDRSAFAEAARLDELATVLDGLLTDDAGIAAAAQREGLSALSYFARPGSLAAAGLDPDAGITSLERTRAWYAAQVDRVDIAVPRFVILGSTEGPFAMTITNDLDRPVRIEVRATTSPGLSIKAPTAIEVPGASSRTVNLVANTTEPGVHSLVLVITDADGHTLRQSATISIRSRDVGWLIWVIMATGATMLFVAIGLRLRKRRRATRRSHG